MVEFWTKFCKILKKYCLNRQGNSSKPCQKDLKDFNSGYFIQNQDFGKSRPTSSAELPEFLLLTNNNLLPQMSLNIHNHP